MLCIILYYIMSYGLILGYDHILCYLYLRLQVSGRASLSGAAWGAAGHFFTPCHPCHHRVNLSPLPPFLVLARRRPPEGGSENGHPTNYQHLATWKYMFLSGSPFPFGGAWACPGRGRSLHRPPQAATGFFYFCPPLHGSESCTM